MSGNCPILIFQAKLQQQKRKRERERKRKIFILNFHCGLWTVLIWILSKFCRLTPWQPGKIYRLLWCTLPLQYTSRNEKENHFIRMTWLYQLTNNPLWYLVFWPFGLRQLPPSPRITSYFFVIFIGFFCLLSRKGLVPSQSVREGLEIFISIARFFLPFF